MTEQEREEYRARQEYLRRRELSRAKRKRKRYIIFFSKWLVLILIVVLILWGIVSCSKKLISPSKSKTTEATTKATVTTQEITTEEATTETASFDTSDYSCFDNSVFIGDCRMGDFSSYANLSNADFLTNNNLTVDNIGTLEITKADDTTTTVYSALQAKKYDKVYIQLGINEIGWAYGEKFVEELETVCKQVQTYLPDATIYVESLLRVTSSKATSDATYSNQTIDSRNELVKTMCETNSFKYVDLNSVISDSDGNIKSDYSSDGIHINQSCSELIRDALIEFTMTGSITKTGALSGSTEDSNSLNTSEDTSEDSNGSTNSGSLSSSENGATTEESTGDVTSSISTMVKSGSSLATTEQTTTEAN